MTLMQMQAAPDREVVFINYETGLSVEEKVARRKLSIYKPKGAGNKVLKVGNI
jgi:hypothetical protein